MPMHDLPLTIAILEHRCSQAAAVNVTRFSVVRHVSRNCVFQSCPGSLSGEMNFDVAKGILRVLHLPHLGNQMMITIIRPAIVRMSALKDGQRFIVGPDSRSHCEIVLFETE